MVWKLPKYDTGRKKCKVMMSEVWRGLENSDQAILERVVLYLVFLIRSPLIFGFEAAVLWIWPDAFSNVPRDSGTSFHG